ncbi:SRPBCC domain-containing protein [Phenylobacterium sp.]|uniref:SRPBCC family protein n=1 Tax=Phenylobacterium sp. TaxID=1871053 RepID=UPI002CF16AD9|nr:SRPBCC domain-containing protein [Phenylobacterium sp.]HLZ75651.1 SRPBCC domain-containing protein [Phenylobacterium sp.]
MRGVLLAAALFVAAPAVAEPAGTRGFEISGVVPAPPAKVFAVFTTPGGWKRLGVPFASVDFRLGGTIETNYDASAHVGQADNIKNQIVAFIPGRMLALRNIQAPPSFPYPKEFAATATVFEFRPAGAYATRVVVSGVGYGDGPAYDWLLDKFKQGDAWTLKALADSFAGKAQAPAATAPKFAKPAQP